MPAKIAANGIRTHARTNQSVLTQFLLLYLRYIGGCLKTSCGERRSWLKTSEYSVIWVGRGDGV